LSAAYKVNDWLSIGGGVDYQTADAKLNRNAVAAIVGSTTIDARTSLAGDDESLGWNAGILVSPAKDWDIGLHYRSAITHDLSGEVRILPPGGAETAQDATAELSLPDIASLAASWQVNDRWRALGSATWYGWSNFDEIRVKRAGLADDVTTQDYKDTLALSLGAEYKYDQDWTLRTGVQYDPTPTTDEFRTSRTPDGDRLWFSAGASNKINDKLTLDLGISYIDIGNETINVTRSGAAAGRSSVVKANTEGHVGIFSAGLTYKF
jgi:long-chain fatty acid transport protein